MDPSVNTDPPPVLRRPTQADVAREAGVSAATVSHILSGRADRRSSGNPETRRRVEQAMARLGYRPNWAGQALRRQRTGLVAAIAASAGNPWQVRMIRELQRALWRHDLDLVTMACGETPEDVERIRMFLDRGVVDACLTLGLDPLPAASRARLAASSVPMLAVGENDWSGAAQVRFGYAEAARTAVRALAARGIDDFRLVLDATAEPGSLEEIFRGPALAEIRARTGSDVVEETVVRSGISPDLDGLGRIDVASGPLGRPLVLLCSSDRLAIQVSDHLARERGVTIGQRIGVVGRGDIEEAKALAVPLSTLGVSDALDGIAEIAEVLAESAATGQKPSTGIELPWRFIERESTRALGAIPAG